MANPQHIDWLLEGVVAWNKRRKESNFRPDFSGYEIEKALREAGQIVTSGRANLRRADLRGADLQGAFLQEADLLGANLRETNLRETNLQGADLRMADLLGADLREADLQGARVYSAARSTKVSAAEYTNLSTAQFLKQFQLDSLDGDNGTLIPGDNGTPNPDGLTRPTHWRTDIDLSKDHPNYVAQKNQNRTDPNTDDVTEQSDQSSAENPAEPKLSSPDAQSFVSQVELILLTLPASSRAGKDAALRLRHAASLYHNETGKNQSHEGTLVEQMADGFDSLADSLADLESGVLDKDGLIAVLGARLVEQEKRIADLKAQLETVDSA